MKTIRPFILTSFLIFILCANNSSSGSNQDTGSASTPSNNIKILQSWQGDFSVSQLYLLPEGQNQQPVGYIDEPDTFSAVWSAFKPTEKTPDINFTDKLVIFARNTQFYNRISIGTVRVSDGTAEVVAVETMSAMPIKVKFSMAIVVVAQDDIQAIRSGSTVFHIP